MKCFSQRFARLSRILPFLPVFGGGTSLFQPVYVDDIAQLVAKLCDEKVAEALGGKTIEAGGPEGTYHFPEMNLLIIHE